MIIEKFLENVESRPNSIAFIDYKSRKLRNKTYQDVYLDMLKVVSYFEVNQINNQSKILIFLKPSYEFYLILLSGILRHYQMIVIESFNDKDKLKRMVTLSNPDYIVVDSKTKLIKNIIKPFKNLKSINISKYHKFQANFKDINYNFKDPVLLTFTSGSTGYPKLIKRTIQDLENQYSLILNTIDNIDQNDIVLALNPIYVLANLVFGITSIIFSKNQNKKSNTKLLEKILTITNANTINASISKYLIFNSPLSFIKKAYSGGSLISLQDAKKIKELFPNTYFTYVYGASEVVLMSKTSIDDYIKNLEEGKICIGKIVSEIDLKIDEPDKYGVGEIIARGKVVLCNDDLYHHTGDIGYIKDGQVYLIGRKKMSSSEFNIYNYDIEMKVLQEFKEISKVAFFVYNNFYYLFYEAKIDYIKEIKNFLSIDCRILRIKKMPIDIRHHYKIDYNKLIDLLKEGSMNKNYKTFRFVFWNIIYVVIGIIVFLIPNIMDVIGWLFLKETLHSNIYFNIIGGVLAGEIVFLMIREKLLKNNKNNL